MTRPGVLMLDPAGHARAATPAASRLLELAASDELPGRLRALAGRCILAGLDRPAVEVVPIASGGWLRLTGEWAGSHLTVIVEAPRDTAGATPPEPFTPRERDVLALLCHGLPTKRIAAQLAISQWTVQDHIRSMFAKAGVSSRGELTALVRDRPAASA